MSEYRYLSYWHDTVDDDLTPRVPLPGDRQTDVVIIGGGLTGLWTAWYLLQREPATRITVLEAEIVGFGESGRNGGRCSARFPQPIAAIARRHGRDAALRMRRAMIGAVDEVARAAGEAGVDIDYAKGGTIAYARDAPQLETARAEAASAAEYGIDPIEVWGAERVRAAGPSGVGSALGATYDPNSARIHPGKLVRGLARALEDRGVTIHERTRVLSWRGSPTPTQRSATVFTDHGYLRAERVVVALGAYAAAVPQTHRRLLPVYSLMLATEPLPDETRDAMGLSHGQTFADRGHLMLCGQRTADDRLLVGGRGAPYHFGSRIRPGFDRLERVFRHLVAELRRLFPQLPGFEVTHRWGGPLGVPRDGRPHAAFDPATGIASAAGYAGDGLATANLAGRTLADLLSGTPSELTTLPWVQHRSPSWEPEPLRWLGVNGGMLAARLADRGRRGRSAPP